MFKLTLQRTLCEKPKKILRTHFIRITSNEESHNLQLLLQSDQDSAFRIKGELHSNYIFLYFALIGLG